MPSRLRPSELTARRVVHFRIDNKPGALAWGGIRKVVSFRVIEDRGEEAGKAMKKYKFRAKIEVAGRGGAYVLFPYDTKEEFATKGKVPEATFDGVPYAGLLIKYGHPLRVLGMPKAIREQTGKAPGDTVEVTVWKDEEVRILAVPAPFENLMKKEGLLPVFEKLSYTHRKEYCRWIADARKEETRLKRLEKALEMLEKGVSTPG
jgi:bifunctional DNA-binding transcriptional regulator/antitoxin component of YhaV-PrlF toxin-antitoxin module